MEEPFEEMLKASARKRRAEFGSDPSMPNPIRARLHEEIASLNRQEERRTWRFSFAWPRFAIAAAAAILVVGLPIFWQWRSAARPATISSARQSEMTAPAAGAAARTDEQRGESEAAAVGSETGKIAAAAPAPAAAKIGALTQQFAQIAAQQESTNAPNVLNNFRLEQNGDSVRVIDADGSTYTGRMERLALTDARALANQKFDYAARAEARSMARKEKKESANEYYIHASGFNTQLKKPLLFEGNYIAEASANEVQDKDEKNAKQARIVGTAKIEGEPPVQVDAMAVPPR